MLANYPGVGLLGEGLLERDPLDETLQLRFLDAEGKPAVVRLQDAFAAYVGREVRLTLAFIEELEAATQRLQARDQVEVITFKDLAEKS